MIELFENELFGQNYESSKGNQLKWRNGEVWYKADYTGYEGFAEYVASKILEKSTLDANEFIEYETEKIKYNEQTFLGCKSKNFLQEGWQLITLERLFEKKYSKSFYKSLYEISGVENRLLFLVEQVENITGIKNFGVYMSKVLKADAFFLNEDRHLHNIAVMLDPLGNYHTAPIFDNGAGLLSDTTLDYPMSADTIELMGKAKAKTLTDNFDDALDAAESLYGVQLKLNFTYNDVCEICDNENNYDKKIKDRVKQILMQQKRKYGA